MKQLLARPLPRARVRHRGHPTAPTPGSGALRGSGLDMAVEKVRQSGGPIDRAAYGCACGFRFSASVSTTVSCPKCGAGQSW
jgi:hypothetical protein